MTINPPPNTRKLTQQLKAAGEQNERMLVRSITTILASVGTLAGWMVLAAQEPTPVVEAVEPVVELPTDTPYPTETAMLPMPTATMAFAPIPTLRAIPGRQILPTLMPTTDGQTVAAAAPAQPADSGAIVPTAASSTLRVVTVPTPAPANGGSTNPAPNPNTGGNPQPTAAAPQPPAPTAAPKPTAKPKPTAAGHSKGSK